MTNLTSKVVKKLKSLYLDEHCIFYLKDMKILASTEEGNIDISAVKDGIVLDIDECYFYIGLPDGTFTGTIQHDIAGLVEIAQDTSQHLDVDFPATEEEIH